MTLSERIDKLNALIAALREWQATHPGYMRRGTLEEAITKDIRWARQEAIDAGCYVSALIIPPYAPSGSPPREVDPFLDVLDPPFESSLVGVVTRMIEKTIAVLRTRPGAPPQERGVTPPPRIRENTAFIITRARRGDAGRSEIVEAIRGAASRAGFRAETAAESELYGQTNVGILDAIVRAEYVIADFSYPRSSIYYEAGFARGIGKPMIYVVRKGARPPVYLSTGEVVFYSTPEELGENLCHRLSNFRQEHP